MKTVSAVAWMALVVAPVGAQETPSPSAASDLEAALAAPAHAGHVRFEGGMAHSSNLQELIEDMQLEEEQSGWVRRFSSGSLGPEGTFQGGVSPGGDMAVRLETESSVLETYRRGGRTVNRTTVVEDRRPPSGEEEELGAMMGGLARSRGVGPEPQRILAIAWLSQNFSLLSSIAEGEREEVSGHPCRIVTAVVPAAFVEEARREEPAEEERRPGGRGGWGRMFRGGGMGGPIEEVRLTFWLDAGDASLRKYSVEVRRGEPEFFDQMRQWMDIPEGASSQSLYEVEIQGIESGAIAFPQEIERLFRH